jgi:hypothetical protein
MREFVRSNGLSLALLALFVVSIVGQALAGWCALAEELTLAGRTAPNFGTIFRPDIFCRQRSRTGRASSCK